MFVGLLVLQFDGVVDDDFETHDFHAFHVVELAVRDEFEEIYEFLIADERRLLDYVGLQQKRVDVVGLLDFLDKVVQRHRQFVVDFGGQVVRKVLDKLDVFALVQIFVYLLVQKDGFEVVRGLEPLGMQHVYVVNQVAQVVVVLKLQLLYNVLVQDVLDLHQHKHSDNHEQRHLEVVYVEPIHQRKPNLEGKSQRLEKRHEFVLHVEVDEVENLDKRQAHHQ